MSDSSSLTISSSTGQYGVTVAASGLTQLLIEDPDALLIVDQRFELLAELEGRRVLSIAADEQHKTLSEVERLLIALRELGAGRSDRLVAVGGGVVQDVATQTAQLYMRGLPWKYAPTTLLGMVDSCIGGKSSINAGAFKNLVGSFYPPAEIVVDPSFLQTLPDEAIAAGLAEATKISYCRGPETFASYLGLESRFGDDPEALILHSLETKRWFIEDDEFDTGSRRLLNFGHSFGHALEAATGFAVEHGIGVALGMISAERFGTATGLGVAAPELVAHAELLAKRGAGLSEAAAGFDRSVFERSFLADKKHGPDGLHLILPSASGSVAEVVAERSDEVVAAATGSVEAVLDIVTS